MSSFSLLRIRVVRRIAMFAFAGVLLNLGVAWTLTIVSRPDLSSTSGWNLISADGQSLVVYRHSAPGADLFHVHCGLVDDRHQHVRTLAPDELEIDIERLAPAAPPSVLREVRRRGHETGELQLWALASGWPVKSFHCSIAASDTDPGLFTTNLGAGGFQLSASTLNVWDLIALPIRPIPRPFIANSVFYAAALAFMVYGRRSLRVVGWRLEGRCGACGYSRRGIGRRRCPECGRAAPGRFVCARRQVETAAPDKED